jgi:hypothetical protein
LENATTLVKRYDKLLSQHPGKWIAIKDTRVIATAQNIEELIDKVKKQNDILIAYSPTPAEKKIRYLLRFSLKSAGHIRSLIERSSLLCCVRTPPKLNVQT